MSIWGIIVVGLVAGIVARVAVPGRNPIGLLGTLAVGVAGAVLGWWAGRALVGPHAAGDHPWIWAILGAIAVLLAVRALTYRRPRWLGRRPLLARRRWGW
jgi:uncharacterized membrane protein YeaQ/YmgE (transglycosylase-associated protein family)